MNDNMREQLRLPYELEPLQTARAILRPLAPADIADVHGYMGAEPVMRYWGPVHTRDETARYLAERATATHLVTDGDFLSYAIEIPLSPGHSPRVVGEMRIVLENAQHARLDIGWILHPDIQGLGYATEAGRALLYASFRLIGAHRVCARLDPRNHASARVAERLGMVHEGVQRETHHTSSSDNGEWLSTSVYSLLSHEYDGQSGPPKRPSE